MAGGAGVEYYFGYELPQNDLGCEDWRSRNQSWTYGRIALDFFRDNKIPFWEMSNANALIGNEKNDNSKFCFAKANEIYLVYLPKGGSAILEVMPARDYIAELFNPRAGGPLQPVQSEQTGEGGMPLRAPDSEDWLFVVQRR
jgi:hypothetical protein